MCIPRASWLMVSIILLATIGPLNSSDEKEAKGSVENIGDKDHSEDKDEGDNFLPPGFGLVSMNMLDGFCQLQNTISFLMMVFMQR